jgi:hypothetical protein
MFIAFFTLNSILLGDTLMVLLPTTIQEGGVGSVKVYYAAPGDAHFNVWFILNQDNPVYVPLGDSDAFGNKVSGSIPDGVTNASTYVTVAIASNFGISSAEVTLYGPDGGFWQGPFFVVGASSSTKPGGPEPTPCS